VTKNSTPQCKEWGVRSRVNDTCGCVCKQLLLCISDALWFGYWEVMTYHIRHRQPWFSDKVIGCQLGDLVSFLLRPV